jgi:xylan 1,4-beta-xylosidase
LVTRRKDGSLAIAVWNLFLPEDRGAPKVVTLHFRGVPSLGTARVTVVDAEHGSPLPAYEKMGSPPFPTRSQIEELRKAAALPAAKSRPIANGSLTINLQPHALALVEIAR